eukprot:13429750-Alexandrium_andersonii.AAC.1
MRQAHSTSAERPCPVSTCSGSCSWHVLHARAVAPPAGQACSMWAEPLHPPWYGPCEGEVVG